MLGLTGPSACSKSAAAERLFVTFMSDIRVIVETNQAKAVRASRQ